MAPAMKAMKAVKAMKAAKAMKAKPMKARKVSVIAKGKRARTSVFSGKKIKTQSGLKKTDLIKSKSGKIVSKKASAASKKNFQGSRIQKWMKACAAARKELKITGFVALNSGPQGKAFYLKAKAHFAKM